MYSPKTLHYYLEMRCLYLLLCSVEGPTIARGDCGERQSTRQMRAVSLTLTEGKMYAGHS